MADRRSTTRSRGNRRWHAAKTGRRVVGASSAVGAFLAFGVASLAGAPAVYADDDFGLGDLVANLFDPGSWGAAGSVGLNIIDGGDSAGLLTGAGDAGAAAGVLPESFYTEIHTLLEGFSSPIRLVSSWPVS